MPARQRAEEVLPMLPSFRLGAAALAITAIAALQACTIAPAGAATSSTAPSPSESTPPTAAAPSPSPAGPPAPTLTFESARYGLSIKYPEGWKTTPGRIAWTKTGNDYPEPLGDLIEDPSHKFLWVKLASTPIGTTPFDTWAEKVLEVHGCTWVPMYVTIDGVQGLVDGQCNAAVVATAGRGYLISAHLCPCELGDITQWNAWFGKLLTTVTLRPELAVDK
jgi:hypothetical protein